MMMMIVVVVVVVVRCVPAVPTEEHRQSSHGFVPGPNPKWPHPWYPETVPPIGTSRHGRATRVLLQQTPRTQAVDVSTAMPPTRRVGAVFGPERDDDDYWRRHL